MHRVTSQDGLVVSYERYGAGPPLVLVHGSFSDHVTNWMYVRERLAARFTVYAIARRGRGDTEAPSERELKVEDEATDVAAVVSAASSPVALLGHSYGAVCALGAAALVPDRVAKLVLYEPPAPGFVQPSTAARLASLGARGDWDGVVETFVSEALRFPRAEVEALRRSPDWATWTSDAARSLRDLRALAAWTFAPERYRSLAVPTLLLTGTESPRERYLTDALAGTLPDARVVELQGQGHEALTTAPDLVLDIVERFLAPAASAGARRADQIAPRRS